MSKESLDRAVKPHGIAVAHPSEHQEHIVGPGIYFAIFGALMVLTAITTGAAFIEMGVFNPIVALAIATTKAILVILFFMHVKYSPKTTMLTIVSGIFFFGILVVLSMSDYISRSWGSW